MPHLVCHLQIPRFFASLKFCCFVKGIVYKMGRGKNFINLTVVLLENTSHSIVLKHNPQFSNAGMLLNLSQTNPGFYVSVVQVV